MDNFQYLWENSDIIEGSGCGFITPPEGEHVVKLSGVHLEVYERNDIERFPLIVFELTLTSGEKAGRAFRKRSILSSKDSIGYFKHDVKIIIGNVPKEFSHVVPSLQNMGIGKLLRVNVTTTKASNGKDYKNIYINEAIDATMETAQTQQSRADGMVAVPQKMNFSGFVPEDVPF